MDLEPGQVVDHYRLDQTIQRGSSTTVYAATDLSLQRRVAFKVLTGTHATDERVKERFATEAQTAASLDAHPNIATVYSWGQVGDAFYFVTEFIAGISLSEMIERQPGGEGLPVGEGVALLGQAAEAIDFAHQRGVVHRDIKPANVMVRMASTPRSAFLVDFGITKVARGADPPPPPPGSPTDPSSIPPAPVLKQVPSTTPPPSASYGPGVAKTFVGTPHYSAPEQITGAPLDHRADIYSLGCTAYEVLCGRPPFADAGEEDDAVLNAHLTAPVPDIVRNRATLPPALNTVLQRALAKRPEDRYRTCGELVAALRAATPEDAEDYARSLDELHAAPAPEIEVPEEPPRRRWPWVAVVCVLVLAFGGLAWRLTNGIRNPSVQTAIGRNVTIPTTTTPTTTTTVPTTEPPILTNAYGDPLGPLTEAASAPSNYAMAVQSRVFDAGAIAALASPAYYYAEWARLMGPPAPDAGAVVATDEGYQITAGETVALTGFETDVEDRVMRFDECRDDGCTPIDSEAAGMVMQAPCPVGSEGCPHVRATGVPPLVAEKVMDVMLRAPEHSMMFRLRWDPPQPDATAPPLDPAELVLPPISQINNAAGSVRFLANGEYFVVRFDSPPVPGTVDTFSVEFMGGDRAELRVTYT